MKEVLCVHQAQSEWEECLWWLCLHVSLCVFLAGRVLGFHYTRTLPPGAFSLSLSHSCSLCLPLSGSVKIPQGLGGQRQ